MITNLIFNHVLIMLTNANYGLSAQALSIRTPGALLWSLSDKYHWEKYEPSYPPSYGLNTITAVLLEGWLWQITHEG